ncbi:DUF559 domain-containing protein [Caulobacter sp.]|uniref:DUF559 domain-containing protein n=1 Tax=Caulobacter sp. TaxID=78 RepID=UPI003BAC2F04
MSDKPKPSHAPGAIRRARRLRREMTVSEKRLWKALRAFETTCSQTSADRPIRGGLRPSWRQARHRGG